MEPEFIPYRARMEFAYFEGKRRAGNMSSTGMYPPNPLDYIQQFTVEELRWFHPPSPVRDAAEAKCAEKEPPFSMALNDETLYRSLGGR